MVAEASKEQLRQYVLRGEWSQVANLCQRLLLIHQEAKLYVLLGKAFVHQGQLDSAIEAYLAGLTVQSEQPESHYALAVLYKRRHQKPLAICHYQLALQQAPGWQKAALGLARLFHQLGDSDQALGEYRKIVRQDPSCAKAHFALGLLHEQKGEDLLAIKSYRQTVFVQPNHVSAFRYLGAALVRLEAYDAAVDVYQQALNLCSDRATLYGALGQACQSQGNNQQAIEAYRQAISLNPTLAIAHRNLGHLSSAAQAMPEALAHFEKAASHTKGKAYMAAASDYAWALAAAGRWDELLTCFGDCVERAEESATAFVLAYCQRTQQLPDDDLLFRLQRVSGQFLKNLLSGAAVEVLRAQLALMYERLADLSMACDAPARAEQCYRFALSLSPDSWPLYQLLGRCLQVQGRHAAELAIYQAGILQAQLPSASSGTSAIAVPFSVEPDSGTSNLIAQGDSEAFVIDHSMSSSLDGFAISNGVTTDLTTNDLTNGLPEISTEVSTEISTDVAVRSTLFSLVETQLQQSIDQAVARHKSGPAVAVKGVYAKAQDWLATLDLAASKSASKSASKPAPETESETSTSEQSASEQSASEQSASEQSMLASEPTHNYLEPESVDPACGGLTCQLCMTNLIRKFSPVQVADSAFRCGHSKTFSQTFSETPSETPSETVSETFNDDSFSLAHFAVTIPDGRAWIAPKQDAWAVCNEIAIFSPDNFLLSNLSRCYPWFLPGCQRHAVNAHSVFQRQTPLPPVQKLSGRVAVLSGLSGHIYYHWLFDVLPRFRVLYEALQKENRSLKEIDYFVVNSAQKGFQRETLQRLGIPLEKVIESDRTPHFQAQELVVPSFAGPLDWVPPSSMDFLRKAFLERAALKRDQNLAETVEVFGKRIYISRTQAKYRQVLNEAAVVELLERFGFVTVALETLSVAQQARLFSEADVVVAAHGSGLANLVFCSADTQVIEFFSPNYLRTDYWMISEYLQLRHYYLIGESFDFHPLRQLMYPSGLTEDFSINLTALRSLLTKMQIAPL